MDIVAAFALPLLSGYYFARYWHGSSYSIRRSEGHHLYFQVTLFGVILFAVAFVVRVWLRDRCPWVLGMDGKFSEIIKPIIKPLKDGTDANGEQIELVLIACYTLLIAPIGTVLANLLTSKHWALKRSLDAFDLVLYTAQRTGMPVAVTLSSGKVYIGLVKSITDPEKPPLVLKLLPMFSGYRQGDGCLKLTTNYNPIYEAVKRSPKDFVMPALAKDWGQVFEVAIRADLVTTINMFSPLAYSKFNPGWEDSIGKPNKQIKQRMIVELKKYDRFRSDC